MTGSLLPLPPPAGLLGLDTGAREAYPLRGGAHGRASGHLHAKALQSLRQPGPGFLFAFLEVLHDVVS